MKRYLLVLTAIALVFALAASVTLASISLPPSDPNNNPPGSFLSEEQQFKLNVARDAARKCQENFDRCIDSCHVLYGAGPLQRGPGSCYDRCLKQYHECHEGLAFFMGEIKPPEIQLPNGNSPGQGK